MDKATLTGLVTALPLTLLLAMAGCQTQPTDQSTAKAIDQPSGTDQQQREEQPVVPSTKLSDTPGAPMTLEEVQEQSVDTPMRVPVVDPTVTNPKPTVTDTPIPTQLLGLKARRGQGINDKGEFVTEVFGNSGRARKIAYIVDASGSMADVLPFVERELRRVVNGLHEKQSFTIIVFSGKGIYEVTGGGAKRGLRAATNQFEEDVRDWLGRDNAKYKTGGAAGKNAEEAILLALSYEPQLIYLMSDNLTGGGQGATQHEIMQDALLKSIRKANDIDPPAKFNTIQFLREDPLVRAGLKGTLQLIADDSGGSYRFVGKRDLNLK
jgi:hypothetical protein